MTRIQIAGFVLFLVALTGFLIVLPRIDKTPDTPSNVTAIERNKSSVQTVIEKEPEAVLLPSGSSAGGKGMQIEMLDLSGFAVGDSLTLYIPQEDESYTGSVTEVNITEAGNRVMTGFLDIDGTGHRFIFTVGRHQTFGTIQTSRNRYQLETRGGEGRIVSVAGINEGLDFSEPDYVVPRRKDFPPEEPRGG